MEFFPSLMELCAIKRVADLYTSSQRKNEFSLNQFFFTFQLFHFSSFDYSNLRKNCCCFCSPEVEDLQAMTWANPNRTQLLVGGINDRMFILDLNRGSLIKEVSLNCFFPIIYYFNNMQFTFFSFGQLLCWCFLCRFRCQVE
jgi:hypothetical protein